MKAIVTDDILDRLAAAMGDDAGKLALLAAVATSGKRHKRAYTLALRARALAPGDAEIAAMTASAMSRTVPSWHVPMLQETLRNDLYDAAIRQAVRPGMRVLDIGTGTGLLAMMAARAGAEAVVTCEMVEPIADAATDIVALNGYADRVSVRHIASTALDPADLGGPVDLVVSEILASNLLGESVLPTLRDAARRLLKPGGTMIPAGGEVRVALAHWGGAPFRVDDASGFDVRPFNRFARRYRVIAQHDTALTLSSAPAMLFGFDFTAREGTISGRAEVELEATAPANGIAQWIRILLDDTHVYENRPGDYRVSGWFIAFTPFAETRPAGSRVTVKGRHNETKVWVWADPDPADARP